MDGWRLLSVTAPNDSQIRVWSPFLPVYRNTESFVLKENYRHLKHKTYMLRVSVI
jgi:hypothetical protein